MQKKSTLVSFLRFCTIFDLTSSANGCESVFVCLGVCCAMSRSLRQTNNHPLCPSSQRGSATHRSNHDNATVMHEGTTPLGGRFLFRHLRHRFTWGTVVDPRPAGPSLHHRLRVKQYSYAQQAFSTHRETGHSNAKKDAINTNYCHDRNLTVPNQAKHACNGEGVVKAKICHARQSHANAMNTKLPSIRTNCAYGEVR